MDSPESNDQHPWHFTNSLKLFHRFLSSNMMSMSGKTSLISQVGWFVCLFIAFMAFNLVQFNGGNLKSWPM
jgi:hypothetical protein